MTNDYKQDILDYITNNVTVTQGTNEPQFTDSKVLDKSVAKRIGTLLGGSYSYGGYLNDENTKNIIIYGFYNNNENGFIYMCDSNLDEIQPFLNKIKNLNELAGYKINKTDLTDGVKHYFNDNESWILARPSGTEPLLRIYFETTTQEKMNTLQDAINKI